MKAWKRNLVTALFVLGALGWLLPVVKQLIKGEDVRMAYIVFAISSFTLAIGLRAAARKTERSSRTPGTPLPQK
jgi:hypothetical protein